MYLLELGVSPQEPTLCAALELLWGAWREDGRFKVYPKGSMFPCETIIVAHSLCSAGFAEDARMKRTFAHLLETQEPDGGWRCKKFYFGRGPETECSNPHPTLVALDAFRYRQAYLEEAALNKAVEFLLAHWEIRKPIGPCHYGIGTLFMQVEYPFRNYNLFQYVYVLSHYPSACQDPRFREAFETLRAKTVEGQIVVERVVPKLAGLNFCRKGQPSALATGRYREILHGTVHRVTQLF